jgi:hypothetical protein
LTCIVARLSKKSWDKVGFLFFVHCPSSSPRIHSLLTSALTLL